MAHIEIQDLPQSDELDRRAMVAIVGGARTGVRPLDLGVRADRGLRVVDYPPGLAHDPSVHAPEPRATR